MNIQQLLAHRESLKKSIDQLNELLAFQRCNNGASVAIQVAGNSGRAWDICFKEHLFDLLAFSEGKLNVMRDELRKVDGVLSMLECDLQKRLEETK